MADRKELLPLGRALDRVLPKVRRDIHNRLLPALLAQPEHAQGLLAQVMAGAYATGVQTGWVVHGTILGGLPTDFTPKQALEWRDRAYDHGEFIANRFGHILDQEPTVAELTRSATVAGESSVWQGQDDAGQEAATLTEAEWKVWVRAWPRTEHRDWHDALEGVTIPEDATFTLPGGPNRGAQVYGPRDWDRVSDPGEHLNCGHALRYQRHATAEELEGTRRGVGVIYTPPTESRVFAAPTPVPARTPTVPPAPATTTLMGSVGDALDVQTRKHAAAVADVIAAIDRVHRTGTLPKIPVKTSSGHADGAYAFRRSGDPVRITLNSQSRIPHVGLAHELGHFIDHKAFGTGATFGSTSNPLFTEWRTAVRASDAYATLKRVQVAGRYTRGGHTFKATPKGMRYVLSDDELWARSYAQFIATEAGDAVMLRELAWMSENYSMPGFTWTPEDFEPIAIAIRALLRSVGWST